MTSPRDDTMDTIHRAGLAIATVLDRARRERRSPALASHTIDAAPTFFSAAPMQGNDAEVTSDFRVFAASFRTSGGEAMLATPGRHESEVYVHFPQSRGSLVLTVSELRLVADALDQIGGASEHSATP